MDLDVKAQTLESGYYVMEGVGKNGSNTVSFKIGFNKKPTTSRDYTPQKDGAYASIAERGTFETVGFNMKSSESIKVTVNGNRIEATLEYIQFSQSGTGTQFFYIPFSGYLSVD